MKHTSETPLSLLQILMYTEHFLTVREMNQADGIPTENFQHYLM